MSFNLNWINSQNTRTNPKDRLLSKVSVDDGGCWNYMGRLDRCGYGSFKIGGRNLGAHKVSYILHKGDFDQSKFEMMHNCHNRRCINPEHITAGTHKDNMGCMETRRRMTRATRSRAGGDKYVFNLIASKKGETMLFMSSYQAQSMGLSSGSISESCNEVKSRVTYRGYKWMYKGVIKIT